VVWIDPVVLVGREEFGPPIDPEPVGRGVARLQSRPVRGVDAPVRPADLVGDVKAGARERGVERRGLRGVVVQERAVEIEQQPVVTAQGTMLRVGRGPDATGAPSR